MFNTKYFFLTIMLVSKLSVSCSNAPEAPQDSPATKANPTSKTQPTSNNAACDPKTNPKCTSSTSGTDKCWAKLLQTPESQACATAGKLYNRAKNKCVDAPIKIKPNCTSESLDPKDLKTAQDKITANLGAEATSQIDQCGSYNANGKDYAVYLVLGKKYTGGADGMGEYRINNVLLCYSPASGDVQTCKHPDLIVSGNGDSSNQALSCTDEAAAAADSTTLKK